MLNTSGHPDNEAALLLLGLFDQAPQEVAKIAEASPSASGESQPQTQPVAFVSDLKSNIHEVGTTASPDADTPQTIGEGSAAESTLKRKRSVEDIRGEAAAIISSAKTRPDLPHFMGFDNQLYRCICGTTIEPDAGTSIQCESCLAWQHAGCFGLREDDLDGRSYYCQLCRSRDESHKPDMTYIDYIQHLARSTETVATDAPVTTEENVRDGKRSRLPSATARGGKTRSRLGGHIVARSVDPEIGDRKPSEVGIDSVSVAAPRNQRKKSMVNPRVVKPKALSSTNIPVEDVPRLEPISEPGVSRVTEHGDCPLRFLDYIPTSHNIVASPTTDAILHSMSPNYAHDISRERLDDVLRATCIQREDLSFGSVCAVEAIPFSFEGARDHIRDPNIFVKIAGNSEAANMVVPSGGTYISSTSEDSGYDEGTYGVYARRELERGSFLGEFRGEIYTASDYERDPTNQYAMLGVPKVFVRRIGAPLGIVIDARRYGTDLRFIRSSCRPNARLLAIFDKHDPSREPDSRIRFGVFCTETIKMDGEVTLPWEWDDNHIIHQLGGDSQLSGLYRQHVDAVIQQLAKSLGVCACAAVEECDIVRLSSIAARPAMDALADRPDHAGKLGAVIGARRHWQATSYREIEPFYNRFQDGLYDIAAHTSYAADYIPDDLHPDMGSEDNGTSALSSRLSREAMSRRSSLIDLPSPKHRVDNVASRATHHESLDELDDVMSVSATSTLTEPWPEDGAERSDFASPASAAPTKHQSPEVRPIYVDSAGIENPTIGSDNSTHQIPRHRLAHSQATLSHEPSATTLALEPVIAPVVLEPEPEEFSGSPDLTLHETVKDTSRLNKKRIDLSRFMRPLDGIAAQSSPLMSTMSTHDSARRDSVGSETPGPSPDAARKGTSPWWQSSVNAAGAGIP